MTCSLALAAGCTFGQAPPLPPRQQAPAGPIQAQPVSDDEFARSVDAVLRSTDPTPKRQGLLAGVVQRQMVHASERLKAKQTDRGLASVLGALYLIRAGEYRPEMLQGSGDEALAQAVDIVAATGDEGRARALYELRRSLLPADHPARRDVDDHLASLQKWGDEQTRSSGDQSMEAAGQAERRAVNRSLLEPTDEALKEAREATARWIDAGLVLQAEYRTAPRGSLRREDMVEGLKALSSGALTLTALLLRHGDIGGAAEAIDTPPVRQVAPQQLAQRLNAAARENDLSAWRDLLNALLHAQDRDEETAADRALVQAAAFRVAAELYRRDPSTPDVALGLSSALSAYGMAEAAPMVLVDAARQHPDARLLSAMMEQIGASMIHEEESDDPASARRVFASSKAVLEVADQASLKGKVRPSAARVRGLAAGVEARAGDLAVARDLLQTAVRDEPSADAWRLLAEVERQLGAPGDALKELSTVLQTPEAQRDALLKADTLLLSADIHRDLNDRPRARDEALEAYRLILAARQNQGQAQGAAMLARAERLLARVLDRLGDDAGARRATDRALLLARGEPRQFAITALEAVARAYVQRDLTGARKAAQESFGVQLRDDELVYIALWLELLERELGARPDGSAARLLASVESGPRWSGRLAAWANGKLTDEGLMAAARTPGQRTEALFYRSLAQRAAGKGTDADAGLREVVRAPTVDLLESTIARELLAGNDRRLPGPLPSAAP